ncbi:hypothetical protein GDO78_018672 [Eleutherodactylus coqui]|uniref:Uncharacterized protein n=1 Tax=Eleutherodactylus coqui TaxID=57060 RepID=A0A8J6B0P0_ELECQ|nr:hypothetical protein GDO78_018672 [Eleutherodactylus coqui]
MQSAKLHDSGHVAVPRFNFFFTAGFCARQWVNQRMRERPAAGVTRDGIAAAFRHGSSAYILKPETQQQSGRDSQKPHPHAAWN